MADEEKQAKALYKAASSQSLVSSLLSWTSITSSRAQQAEQARELFTKSGNKYKAQCNWLKASEMRQLEASCIKLMRAAVSAGNSSLIYSVEILFGEEALCLEEAAELRMKHLSKNEDLYEGTSIALQAEDLYDQAIEMYLKAAEASKSSSSSNINYNRAAKCHCVLGDASMAFYKKINDSSETQVVKEAKTVENQQTIQEVQQQQEEDQAEGHIKLVPEAVVQGANEHTQDKKDNEPTSQSQQQQQPEKKKDSELTYWLKQAQRHYEQAEKFELVNSKTNHATRETRVKLAQTSALLGQYEKAAQLYLSIIQEPSTRGGSKNSSYSVHTSRTGVMRTYVEGYVLCKLMSFVESASENSNEKFKINKKQSEKGGEEEEEDVLKGIDENGNFNSFNDDEDNDVLKNPLVAQLKNECFSELRVLLLDFEDSLACKFLKNIARAVQDGQTKEYEIACRSYDDQNRIESFTVQLLLQLKSKIVATKTKKSIVEKKKESILKGLV